MEKMAFKNQIILVNTCILAGLIFQYFRGNPMLGIVIAGLILLIIANLIFFVRSRRAKNVQ